MSPRNVTTTATRGSFAAPPRAHSSLEPPHRRPQTTHYAVSPVRVSEHRNAGSGGSMIVRGESTPVTRQRRNSSAARLKQLQALVPSDDGTHSTSTATDSPREPPPLPPSDERSATPAAAAPSDDADEFAKLIDDAAAAAESDVKRGKSIQHVIDDGVSSSTHSSGSVIGKMNRYVVCFVLSFFALCSPQRSHTVYSNVLRRHMTSIRPALAVKNVVLKH